MKYLNFKNARKFVTMPFAFMIKKASVFRKPKKEYNIFTDPELMDIVRYYRGGDYTTLELSNKKLYKIKFDSLLKAFAAIPPKFTKLDLISCELHSMQPADIVRLFAAIPPTITELNLSYNDLGFFDVAAIRQILSSLHHVNVLDLSCNALILKTRAEQAQIFAAIQPAVTILNLSDNALGFNDNLAQAFAGIPATVQHLILRNTTLERRTGAELQDAFAALPRSLVSLNLSYNTLGSRSAAELAAAFTALPPNLLQLSLVKTVLTLLKAEDLAIVFAAIPASVRYLNLMDNVLSLLVKGNGLGTVFAYLPTTIKHLDLSLNHFDDTYNEDAAFVQSFAALPQEIENVKLIEITVARRRLLKTIGLHCNYSQHDLARYTAFDKQRMHKDSKGFFVGWNKALAAKNRVNFPDSLEPTLLSYLTPRDAAQLRLVCKG